MDHRAQRLARQAWKQQAELANAELGWMLANVETACTYWQSVFDSMAQAELRVLGMMRTPRASAKNKQKRR